MSAITDAETIERARWLAVRGALRLEIRGMKRKGRSARQLANDITGKSDRTARKAYASLDARIVEELGESFGRPLPASAVIRGLGPVQVHGFEQEEGATGSRCRFCGLDERNPAHRGSGPL